MREHDRREMERFPLKLKASLSHSDGSLQMELMTANICAGGAFILSKERMFPVGTDVRIDLVLPLGRFKNMAGKSSRIKVTGEIIRSDNQGMAICFDSNSSILPTDI